MEKIFHEKEEEGVFYGAFSYLTEGAFTSSFEAKCSQANVNTLLQKARFVDGLTVYMDDKALLQSITSLHIANYFGLQNLTDMENLFLVNWQAGQLEVFGSLLAMYQVLKSEGLTLLPLSAKLHPTISTLKENPGNAKGYLYYLQDHWMVLRQLSKGWYKFDPWLGGPQILTHFYVSLYIKQLVADGKLVFVVDGDFPACPADTIQPEIELDLEPESSVIDPGKPSIDLTEAEISESLRFLDLVFEDEDNELALALLLSLEDDHRRTKENESLVNLLGSQNVPNALPVNEQPLQNSCPTPQVTMGGLTLTNNHNMCLIETHDSDSEVDGPNSGIQVRRKNGTAISPKIVQENDETDLYFLMFQEPDAGTNCLSPPSSSAVTAVPSSSKESQPSCSTSGSLPLNLANKVVSSSPTKVSSSAAITSGPVTSAEAAAPKVFIYSSDRSTFKKVISMNTNPEEDNEKEMCCVCWNEEPSHVVVPCGHYCLCASCTESILQPHPNKSRCPICKQETTSIIKLFK